MDGGGNAPHCSKFLGRLQGNQFSAKHSNSLGLWFAGYTCSKEADAPAVDFNRVNSLVWVLHESARSFSLAVESLELAGSSTAELAMAWNGKDVHQWHKRIAHPVAVYAMLKTAIEVEILLSQERHDNPSPVRKISSVLFCYLLQPQMNLLEEFIDIEKLGSNPTSCPLSKMPIGNIVVVHLMNLSHGLAQRKLSVAFCKETMILDKLPFNSKVRIYGLDELVKDFLSYSECGSLFIYPEFSSISVYHFFMEVVTDEIGWLDFYGAISCISYRDLRRSKLHAIQAEKEMISSKVFTPKPGEVSGFTDFCGKEEADSFQFIKGEGQGQA
ncbi:hypothetical protein PTKIN_Ptkin13bG0118100 [Pterospermum kingtungense]